MPTLSVTGNIFHRHTVLYNITIKTKSIIMKMYLYKIGVAFMVLLSMVTYANAQKVDYGVLGGIVLSHPKGVNNLTGFTLGAKTSLAFRNAPSHGYFDAQLKFTLRGWKDDIDETDESGNVIGTLDESWKTYYLELPLHIGYKLNLTDKTNMFVDIGPYFAVGLFGKSKAGDYEIIGNVFADNAYKRFDWGLGGNIGIEYDHVQVALGLNYSMMSPTKSGGYAWEALNLNPKDRSFLITVTYMFN